MPVLLSNEHSVEIFIHLTQGGSAEINILEQNETVGLKIDAIH